MDPGEVERARLWAREAFRRAGIVVTGHELAGMEVTDFGLGRFEEVGLCILVYVNTRRVCAKELVLLPGQTCPEHHHPPLDGEPGKEETFRCRTGSIYLYVPGSPPQGGVKAKIPPGMDSCFTVFGEVVLRPGDQYTLPPDTLHWFQAGPNGAIVSEFSTRSVDERDAFTDPAIRR
ncbi:MAG: D-lyxose/D-mannose family sugar isomerase [Promethearchaeota archaeon]